MSSRDRSGRQKISSALSQGNSELRSKAKELSQAQMFEERNLLRKIAEAEAALAAKHDEQKLLERAKRLDELSKRLEELQSVLSGYDKGEEDLDV